LASPVEELRGYRVLEGIAVDILENGRIDLPDTARRAWPGPADLLDR